MCVVILESEFWWQISSITPHSNRSHHWDKLVLIPELTENSINKEQRSSTIVFEGNISKCIRITNNIKMLCTTFLKSLLFIPFIGLIAASAVLHRIVNGVETYISEFPHQVSLRLTESSIHFCGGAILSDSWILSAAQCTQDSNSSPENIYVVVGATNISRGGFRYNLEKIVNHPDFNWANRQNDISMLKTSQQLRISNEVFPVALPSYKTNYIIENGIGLTMVTLTGYGNSRVCPIIQLSRFNF